MKILTTALVCLMSIGVAATGVIAAGMPPPTEDAFGGMSPSAEAKSDSDTDSDIPIDLSDASRIEAGKERYHSTCADFCHGHTPVLFVGRPIEPHHAFQAIFDGGRGATPMPPWGDVFSEEEIWELVAYLNYLGKQPAP